MNNLQIFNNPEFGEIRTIQRDGEPWFVLKDVCNVLDLGSPHKVADRLEDDEKGRNLIPTPGGPQEVLIINEYGLYKVVFRSDKPKAKPFTNWVTPIKVVEQSKAGLISTRILSGRTAWCAGCQRCQKCQIDTL